MSPVLIFDIHIYFCVCVCPHFLAVLLGEQVGGGARGKGRGVAQSSERKRHGASVVDKHKATNYDAEIERLLGVCVHLYLSLSCSLSLSLFSWECRFLLSLEYRHDRFHWKCYPKIHQIANFKFLGTNSNSIKIWIRTCTVQHRGIFRLGGFRGCSILSGVCRIISLEYRYDSIHHDVALCMTMLYWWLLWCWWRCSQIARHPGVYVCVVILYYSLRYRILKFDIELLIMW